MKLTGIAAVCLLSLTLSPIAAAEPAAPEAAAAAARCGSFSYGSSAPVSSTHYGVKNIRQERDTCRAARKVARASEGKGGEKYTKLGWRCKPRKLTDAGTRRYVCWKFDVPDGVWRPKATFTTLGNG